MIIGVAIAALIGAAVYSDANTLRARGITVGDTSPGRWFWFSFLLAIIAVPLYLIKRSEATSFHHQAFGPPPYHQGWVPPPAAPGARPGDRFCGACGTALSPGARFCGRCGSDRGQR